MPNKPRRFALSLLGLAVSSCVGQDAIIASQAKTSLIGSTKEQILACMGAPPQHAIAGKTEVWSYSSIVNTITLGFASSSYAINRYCVVNIVMSGERVSAVNYTGRTGELDEQCAVVVKNCVPKADRL
jgi:hypothetical protein